MDSVDKDLLKEISDISGTPEGAYNIRKNGKGIERKVTENINIVPKEEGKGIDIYVKENTNGEIVHIPVIITESGLTDVVYNDFYIGKNAKVYIIAGCGIHNDHHKDSRHDGIHRFFLEEGASVKYIEKHYGEGDGDGKRILNPVTEVHMKKGSNMEMERERHAALAANRALIYNFSYLFLKTGQYYRDILLLYYKIYFPLPLKANIFYIFSLFNNKFNDTARRKRCSKTVL